MKKQKIIISGIVTILIVGIILMGIYFNNNVIPNENETNNSAPPAPSIDYATIEATVLNLSINKDVVTNEGIKGKLYGLFVKVSVDKVINYTRDDSTNVLKFDPLISGDIITIRRGCSFEYNLSIGDKSLINIYSESSSGEPLYGGFEFWYEKCV
ncbi:MAG: hypothetical protein PHQ66_00745 [Candidatus Nanoarchaeia archaeon]|nr:hypothetical protein [Candidatus Nanoarchaeia archaeon]MDD5358494.1 hypothetical protein [Candidatus Nanoarchaeia archaeon]MDD5589008.1 hypothetical protein [Candidatus Nanoarchaeia archaeon]